MDSNLDCIYGILQRFILLKEDALSWLIQSDFQGIFQ